MMERTNLSGTSLRTAFVLLLVLAIFSLFLAVLWPFITPLLLAAILATLSQPLYQSVTRLVGGRRSLGSFVTLLILFLLVVGPLSAFLGVVVRQAVSVSTDAIPWVQQHFAAGTAFNAHDWLVERFPRLEPYVPDQNQLMESAGNVAKAVGAFLVAGASRVGAGTAIFLLDLFVMLYAMFFFLRDGRAIVEKIFYYTPLNHKDEARLLQRFTSVTRATIKGTLVIGVIQGTLAGLGFWAAGIEGAAFWGTIMTILSVVPGIGAALIWVPGVAYLYLTGHALAATLLLIWCSAIVGTVDNILRPTLVGKDAKMPDLLILIGTLGGLFLFGPIGFIVGPIVCGLFLTVLDIYGSTFKEVLPPVRDLVTGKLKKPSAILDNPPG
ncbi:MAG: AI-2E family transporter [Chthoniobacterales bacterium]